MVNVTEFIIDIIRRDLPDDIRKEIVSAIVQEAAFSPEGIGEYLGENFLSPIVEGINDPLFDLVFAKLYDQIDWRTVGAVAFGEFQDGIHEELFRDAEHFGMLCGRDAAERELSTWVSERYMSELIQLYTCEGDVWKNVEFPDPGFPNSGCEFTEKDFARSVGLSEMMDSPFFDTCKSGYRKGFHKGILEFLRGRAHFEMLARDIELRVMRERNS